METDKGGKRREQWTADWWVSIFVILFAWEALHGKRPHHIWSGVSTLAFW